MVTGFLAGLIVGLLITLVEWLYLTAVFRAEWRDRMTVIAAAERLSQGPPSTT